MAAAAALLWLAGNAFSAPTRIQIVHTLAQADSLARASPTPVRDKALVDWAKQAPVNDIAWVLRHPSLLLGGAEVPLLDLAFVHTPSSRPALRQRWLARRALRAAKPPKKGEPPPPDLSALRAEASVFRLAAILPDEGEYAEYGRAVRAALAAGSLHRAAATAVTIDTLGRRWRSRVARRSERRDALRRHRRRL